MLDTALVMLSGTMLGIVSGLIPGIGTVVTLLISYPFIQQFDLLQTLIFYLAVVSAAQYSGSVVATTMGIPGDSSSFPAVTEGHALFKKGQGQYAISGAALGSVVGSIITVLAVYLIMPGALTLIKNFYNNNIQLAILVLSSALIIFCYGNRLQNIALFIFGALLSSIGISSVPSMLMWAEIIPYQSYPSLYQGLPMFPVVVALFVIPTIAQSWNTKFSNIPDAFDARHKKMWTHVVEYFRHITSSLRGSFIGSVCGLVPHLTTVLASNLSYVIEKKIGISNKTYATDGDSKSLIAAETANNSAGFMQLVPLLLIGVPITTSEAIILSMLENNSVLVNYSTTVVSGLFDQLVGWFVIINIIAFLLAWPMAKHVQYLYKIQYHRIATAIIALLVLMIWYVGAQTSNEIYHLLVFLALAPIGYCLRNTNTLVIVLAFVLQDKLLAAAVRASIIWTS